MTLSIWLLGAWTVAALICCGLNGYDALMDWWESP